MQALGARRKYNPVTVGLRRRCKRLPRGFDSFHWDSIHSLVEKQRTVNPLTCVRFAVGSPFRVRLTVGQQALNLPIEVRILDPERRHRLCVRETRSKREGRL